MRLAQILWEFLGSTALQKVTKSKSIAWMGGWGELELNQILFSLLSEQTKNKPKNTEQRLEGYNYPTTLIFTRSKGEKRFWMLTKCLNLKFKKNKKQSHERRVNCIRMYGAWMWQVSLNERIWDSMLGTVFLEKKSSESGGKSEAVYALSFVYHKIHWKEKLILVHFLIWGLYPYPQLSWLRLIRPMFMWNVPRLSSRLSIVIGLPRKMALQRNFIKVLKILLWRIHPFHNYLF